MGKLNDLLTSIISKVNASVKTEAQPLTDEQKAQARQNIGAAAEGGGGGVQPDWNQTDETAADFIKNKPFYTDVQNVIPEQTYTMGEDSTASISANGIPSIGSILDVVLNGVTYNCKVFSKQAMTCVGNGIILGDADTGEPFLIAWVSADIAMLVPYGPLDATGTVKVSGSVDVRIPKRYISVKTVFYINPSDSYLYIDGVFTRKASISDIQDSWGTYITVSTNGLDEYAPVKMTADVNTGYATVSVFNDDGTIKTFYTAEYTPPTT